MTDIASLGFAIDSSQAASATQVLNQMSSAAANAAQTVERLKTASQQTERENDALARSYRMLNEELRGQVSVIDALVSRVDLLSRGLVGLQGPLRELMQAQQQLSAVSKAFGTTTEGLESFARASRTVGLSSTETVTALERIRSALENITTEGRAARSVLQDYGVNLAGMGRGDEDRILRQFASQLRSFQDTANRTRDAQRVLGPLSIDTLTSLEEPAFRTEAQRARELRDADIARQGGAIRENSLRALRRAEVQRRELEDLNNEYGDFFDATGLRTPFGVRLEDEGSQRRRLEGRRASGVRSTSQNIQRYVDGAGTFSRLASDISSSFSPELAERNIEYRAGPLYEANQANILARFYDEQQSGSATWFGRQFNYAYRSLLNRVPGGYQATSLPGDTRGNPQLTSAVDTESRDLLLGGMRYALNGSMGALGRRNEVVALARAMGLDAEAIKKLENLDTADAMLGPQGQAAGMPAWMQAAAGRRFSAMDDIYTLQSGAQRGDRDFVSGREMAGYAGGSASGQRARYEAEAELRLRERIIDVKKRETELNAEMEEYDRRMGERQERINIQLREQTSILTARNDSLLASMSLGVEPGSASVYAQQAAARQQAALTPGGNPDERNRQIFADRAGGFLGGIASLQISRQENEVLLGAYRSGASTQEANDLLRIYREQRQERELEAAAGRENLDRAKQMIELMRQQTAILREQTAELNIRRTQESASTTRENTDYYLGLTPFERDRRQRIDERAGRMAPGNEGLDPEQARRAGRGVPVDQQATADRIMDFLVREKGIPIHQAQGILDNLYRESRLNPGAVSPDGSSFGLAQWRGSRVPSDLSLEGQLAHLWREIQTGPNAYRSVLGASNRVEAESRFRLGFERPAAWVRPEYFPGAARFAGAATEAVDAEDDRRRRTQQEQIDFQRQDLNIGRAARPADNLYAEGDRLRAQAARGEGDPVVLRDRARLADQGVDAGLAATLGRFGFQSGSLREIALGRFGLRNITRSGGMDAFEASAQALDEINQGAIPAGARSVREGQILTGRGAGLLDNIGGDNQNLRERVEQLQDLARAYREGGAAIEEAQRRQEVYEKTSRAINLAAELEKRGITDLAAALRRAATDYDEFTKKRVEASREGRFNAQRRGDADERDDLEFQLGGGLLLSPASQRRELAIRRARRAEDRGEAYPGSADSAGTIADMRTLADQVNTLKGGWLDMKASASDALATIIQQGGNATDVIRRLGAEVASSFIRRGTSVAMDQIWGAAEKGLSWAAGKLFSQGGYLDGPIVPMANGMVFNRVTDFMMGNGQMGRAGEAGDEAAVPLIRMPSGKLGVASGGGRGDTNITIHMNGGGGGGQQASAEQARLIGEEVKKAVREANQSEMLEQQRLGGMLNPIM